MYTFLHRATDPKIVRFFSWREIRTRKISFKLVQLQFRENSINFVKSSFKNGNRPHVQLNHRRSLEKREKQEWFVTSGFNGLRLPRICKLTKNLSKKTMTSIEITWNRRFYSWKLHLSFDKDRKSSVKPIVEGLRDTKTNFLWKWGQKVLRFDEKFKGEQKS